MPLSSQSTSARVLAALGLARSADPAGDVPAGVRPPSRDESSPTQLALGLISTYRSIALLATGASQLTLDSWRGPAPVDPKPALIRRPDVRPHRHLSSWLSETVVSLATSGNAYWRLSRDDRGAVTSAVPLNPWLCWPHEDGTVSIPGLRRPATEWDVAHVRLMTRPGLPLGLGPIQAARAELDGIRDVVAYAAAWFKSGDVPTGTLSTDQDLTDTQAKAYRDQWEARDKHGVAVLGKGLTYAPVLISPKDAQFIESREFAVADVARLFGIPAHLLHVALEGSTLTYQNVAQADLTFVRWSLSQYLRPIEEAMTSIAPAGQTVRFNLDALLRADTKTRYEAHAIATGKKPWLLPSEVREIEGLAPRPGIDTTPARKATP